MNSRKKMIYGGIVGAGLIALLVDRLLPSDIGPGPAEAVASPGSHAAAAAPLTANPLPQVVASPFPPGLRTQTGVRDVFAISPAVSERLDAQAETAIDGSPAARRPGMRPRAAEFRDEHRLTAVLRDGQTQIAIVDGRWVREGEKIDGCPLRRVDGQTAWFECADAEAELTLRGTQP